MSSSSRLPFPPAPPRAPSRPPAWPPTCPRTAGSPPSSPSISPASAIPTPKARAIRSGRGILRPPHQHHLSPRPPYLARFLLRLDPLRRHRRPEGHAGAQGGLPLFHRPPHDQPRRGPVPAAPPPPPLGPRFPRPLARQPLAHPRPALALPGDREPRSTRRPELGHSHSSRIRRR